MALPEALVDAYFTSARPLSIGLARRGAELTPASGYRRSKVASDGWTRSDGSALARGYFGPFTTPVEFDQALLFDGDQLIETVQVDGPVALPPGTSWTQELVVAVAGA
jgi:hypothetical protein